MQGIAGHQYYVRITLLDNNVFESEPETLIPTGDIEKVYYEFDERIDWKSEDFIEPQNGFNVYVDAKVLPEQEGLIRWRTTGTWELKTYPELRTELIPGPGGTYIVQPAPTPCSGYIYVKQSKIPGSGRTELLYQKGPCSCCLCWINQYDSQPLLSDPRFDSDGVKRKFLTFIPASRRMFYAKYHVQVEQMSLSKKSYDFWNTVMKQRQTGSDLFQTPPPKSVGNMRTVTGNDKVFGYFGASSVKVSSFFIERDAIPYYLPPIDTIAESCSLGYKYYTTTKPFFW